MVDLEVSLEFIKQNLRKNIEKLRMTIHTYVAVTVFTRSKTWDQAEEVKNLEKMVG